MRYDASHQDETDSNPNDATQLSEEVDQLEASISGAKKKIDAHTSQAATAESASSAAASAAQAHLRRCEARAAAFEARLRAASGAVESLKQPVTRLFNVIGWVGCVFGLVSEGLPGLVATVIIGSAEAVHLQ